MTDATTRALARQAATGDHNAAVALLRHRMRAGELDRAAVELAAYCGDEVAREVVGKQPWTVLHQFTPDRDFWKFMDSFREKDFARWLSGLSRWPGAEVRAAVAAGWCALEVWEHSMGWRYIAGYGWEPFGGPTLCAGYEARRPRRALTLAQAYADDPTEANREAWESLRDITLPLWVPMASDIEDSQESLVGIDAAANLAGKATVREAICEALIEWVLA